MSEPRAARHRDNTCAEPTGLAVPPPNRVGDLAAVAQMLTKLQPPDESVTCKRKLIAEFCRLVGEQVGRPAPRGVGLAPRLRQTLERLLAGDSEKQIAARLGVSPHTVHVYVKGLYRHYGVNSRGELLARFVRGGGGPEPARQPAANADTGG